MSTPHTPASGNGPDRASVAALIEQLQSPVTWKDYGLWRAYLCAVLYGAIAAIQGREFFILFSGVLVVAFLLHDSMHQRNQRQVDVLVKLVRELERSA